MRSLIEELADRHLAAALGQVPVQVDYAYLNYVQEAVEDYLKRMSALPGFWVESPSAAIEAGPEFRMKHAEQLLKAMVRLKESAIPGD